MDKVEAGDGIVAPWVVLSERSMHGLMNRPCMPLIMHGDPMLCDMAFRLDDK